ncbi:YopX family protein [Jeotgalibaca porci]|uniref:YopX family protein n=1 Tax=Jeotgalibaca porci TaxID=1868793 RepID=UPI00359FBD51
MIHKFRAWDKESKTMDTVRRITWTDGYITDVYLENIGLRRLDQVILMQSTGLIDVKGFEIFEEDMVKLTEKTINGGIYTHTCKVFQSKNGAWRLEGRPDFSKEYTTKRELYSVRSRTEIIGNVYENPEFTEVQE